MSREIIVGRCILRPFSQVPFMLINMSVFVDLFEKWCVLQRYHPIKMCKT